MFHQVRILARSKQSCSPTITPIRIIVVFSLQSMDHSRHHYRSAVSIDLRNANRLRSSALPRTRFHPNFHRSIKTLYPTSRRFSLPLPSPKLQRKFYQRSRSNTFISFVLQRIEIRRSNPGEAKRVKRVKRVKRRSKKTTTTTMMMMDLAQRFT